MRYVGMFILFAVCTGISAAVHVSGKAVVYVVPDEVILTVGIEVTDVEIEKAQLQNEQIVVAAQKVCADMGIKPGDLSTNCLSLDARYDDDYRKKRFLHYVALNTMAISIKDISRVAELRKQLIKVGVNRIHGVKFKSTTFKEHREKAREMACKAALEKATKMLAVFNQKPGALKQLSEGNVGNGFHYYGNAWYGYNRHANMAQNINDAAEAGGDDQGLALGKIAISAQVSVQFEIQ